MKGGSDRVDAVAFTADSRALATGHEGDRDIHLWEVATGRHCGRLKGHQAGICALALSPDGRHLASGSEDSTILIWDMESAIQGNRPLKARLSPGELQRLWAVLQDESPLTAREAIRDLTGAPEDSVPFLRDRVPCAPRHPSTSLPCSRN
jgi:WD40 repeat protein